MASFPTAPSRTTELEQRIRIGTGFYGKWYRSQREHMLGWIVFQECQERKKGRDPEAIDAKGMWNRLKCSPSMFWLAECAGVSDSLLDEAGLVAQAAADINPKDGDPRGKMMRTVLPWEIIEDAISANSQPLPKLQAHEEAMIAFDRLAEKTARYRQFRKWLP